MRIEDGGVGNPKWLCWTRVRAREKDLGSWKLEAALSHSKSFTEFRNFKRELPPQQVVEPLSLLGEFGETTQS